MILRDIAHCRSGDKGNTANLSVIAYRAEDSALLSQTLHSVSYSLGAHRRRLDIVTAGNNTAI